MERITKGANDLMLRLCLDESIGGDRDVIGSILKSSSLKREEPERYHEIIHDGDKSFFFSYTKKADGWDFFFGLVKFDDNAHLTETTRLKQLLVKSTYELTRTLKLIIAIKDVASNAANSYAN